MFGSRENKKKKKKLLKKEALFSSIKKPKKTQSKNHHKIAINHQANIKTVDTHVSQTQIQSHHCKISTSK